MAAGHVTARAGTNITIACPGVAPTTYVYLVEWLCLGCRCNKCPNPDGEGKRLLRSVPVSSSSCLVTIKMILWGLGNHGNPQKVV